MVGHAVIVGTRAVGQGDATSPGVSQVDVLVARTQCANQLQLRQRIHLRGRQADGADGEHGLHTGAVAGDGFKSLGRFGRVEELEGLCDLRGARR